MNIPLLPAGADNVLELATEDVVVDDVLCFRCARHGGLFPIKHIP